MKHILHSTHIMAKSGRELLKIKSCTTLIRPFADQNHFEPKELAWQWRVKKDSSIYHCSLACIPRACPKRSFFPKLKATYVPKEKYSCEKKIKKMTWKEYFSYLLPDSMAAPKPPLRTCRKLLSLRHNLCLDPQDWACSDVSCMTKPKEWYGQGVVHAIISNLPEVQKAPVIKPCSPPDHMIPRCVIAKKGIAPKLDTSKTCFSDDIYKEPYGDFKGFSPSQTATVNMNKFICRVKCFHDDVPKIQDKATKLSCRWHAEFKDVECPKQMFTRFKNIKITPCGDIKPISAKVDKHKTIEIKKGICGRSTLLRPSGIRNFSTNSSFNYPVKKGMSKKHKHFVRETGSKLQPKESFVPTNFLMHKVGMNRPHEGVTTPNQKPQNLPPKFRFHEESTESASKKSKSLKAQPINNKFKELLKEGSRGIVSREFSTSATSFTKKEQKEDSKKQDHKPICSGCPGIRQAMEDAANPDKKKVSAHKCRKRAAGQCPGPTREQGPNDPPITSPYWKCKTEHFSRCNQPRPKVCKKERNYKMPCQKEDK